MIFKGGYQIVDINLLYSKGDGETVPVDYYNTLRKQLTCGKPIWYSLNLQDHYVGGWLTFHIFGQKINITLYDSFYVSTWTVKKNGDVQFEQREIPEEEEETEPAADAGNSGGTSLPEPDIVPRE